MYKKVTHTIVEEHFSHPMAGEIKEALDKKGVSAKYKMEVITVDKFRSDIVNYLNSLNIKLHNVFKAIEANNETALAESEKVLFEGIDTLGNMFKSYYGIEFGERLNQHFRTTALLFVAIAKNLKNKMDIRDWRFRLDAAKFDLSNLLYNSNNIWRLPETQGVIGQISNELINHAQAIINRDATETASTSESLNNLWTLFANTLANGTVQQFPNKFIAQ